ncbi:MAG: Acetyltransferase, partial [Klenkia sp.]|nr:Acetyltransferase [Klenkia sp.]
MLGRVVRCPADVSPFLAMPADTTEQDRADAATLVGPGGVVPRAGATSPPPPDGGTVHSVPGVQ